MTGRVDYQQQRKRADNYAERQWRDEALRTGRYKRHDRVPGEVLKVMRRELVGHLMRVRRGEIKVDVAGELPPVVAEFVYKGRRAAEFKQPRWLVHADGTVTIGEQGGFDPLEFEWQPTKVHREEGEDARSRELRQQYARAKRNPFDTDADADGGLEELDGNGEIDF
jgi:hypothetical protein